MKILIVSQYYYPERNSVADIAEGLFKLGHKVSVLTGKPNYGFHKILPEYKKVKYEVINGVEVYRVKLSPRKDSRISIYRNYLSFHRNAKRFVRHFKERFDIVLSISLSPVISIAPAILFAKKNNIPHVLYCEDLWPESTVVTGAVKKDSLVYKFLYRWSKSLYSKCDDIFISSPSFKTYFNEVLGISDKSFIHINQPIILSKADNLPVSYTSGHNFVYAGNIAKLQLTDKLIEAFKLIDDDNIKLHLMGMGGLLPTVLEEISKPELKDKIIYHGALPIEQAETFYKNADALIVPLKDSGYVGKTIPNKAVQYLKYGRPIVCIAKGDTKELLSRVDGSIYSEEDPESIKDAIIKFTKLSDSKKSEMGKNNKKLFDKELSTDKLVKRFEEELIKKVK